MKNNGLLITEIDKDSIADELGIQPGDRLIAINDVPLRDFLDYRFLCANEELIAKVVTANNEQWEIEIEKDYDEDLGLAFGEHSFGPTRRCHNRCVFCFVDQMAPSMRETLYIKDDDYRLSFWQGNFVSLTNVKEDELRRIIEQKLGPLYISVHTTNPELRCRMLNNRHAGKILEQLRLLAEGGIEMQTQIVLCPEINDGEELKRSINDLAKLWPQVHSLAVVPVGLTKYRTGLANLRTFTVAEAQEVITMIEGYQQEFLENWDYPFVFASDEFYVMAGKPIPPRENYADFPQTENGIGLARLFLDEWEEIQEELPNEIEGELTATLITGTSGETFLRPVTDRLNRIKGLKVQLEVVPNHFFGESVTVAGLLTAGDIIRALKGKNIGDRLVLPSVMLRDGEDVFLDDLTVNDVSQQLGVTVVVAEGPRDLVEVALGIKSIVNW
ncbi:radical SAM protein [Desulfotomaculum defluvii]